ncbi:MAG TPA: hypothetical protein VHU84_05845 [Lacipirellulaceae bacterium]|jgi:hypothetical protein|nr:hypothetical protein [Lacipirellulaceae bacterium]
MASNDDMTTTINRLTGGLINAILGALILWVGQATLRHAGILASMDESPNNVKHQFEDVDQRQDSMRKWLENVVSEMKDNSRSQFTAKDGDNLVNKLHQAEQSTAELERKFVDRLSALDLRLATLETQHRDSQEVAALKLEITQLRTEMSRPTVVQQQEPQYQPSDRVARTVPVFLPPVDSRR